MALSFSSPLCGGGRVINTSGPAGQHFGPVGQNFGPAGQHFGPAGHSGPDGHSGPYGQNLGPDGQNSEPDGYFGPHGLTVPDGDLRPDGRNCDYCDGQDSSCPGSDPVRSWWVPELPSDFPECPPGFMWLVIPCPGEHVGDAVAAPVVLGDHVECSLHDAGLENSDDSFFVEPAPDEIVPEVCEYQQVQAVSWLDAATRGPQEFVLDPADFPDLSAGVRGPVVFSVNDDVPVVFSSTQAVPQATSPREVPAPVPSSLHPGWMALACRLPEAERHLVFLQRYDSSGDWGACSCCTAWEGRTVWVDRDDHFSCRRATSEVGP